MHVSNPQQFGGPKGRKPLSRIDPIEMPYCSVSALQHVQAPKAWLIIMGFTVTHVKKGANPSIYHGQPWSGDDSFGANLIGIYWVLSCPLTKSCNIQLPFAKVLLAGWFVDAPPLPPFEFVEIFAGKAECTRVMPNTQEPD